MHVNAGTFAINSLSGRAALVRGHSRVSADQFDVAGHFPPADLSVTIDDGANSATAGNSTTYTITVTNNGLSDVVGAHIVDNFLIGSDNINYVIGGSLGCFGGGSQLHLSGEPSRPNLGEAQLQLLVEAF